MRIATGALLVATLLFGACGTNDGGVDVTLHIDDSIDDAQLQQIDQLVIHASGDDIGTYPLTVSNVQRTERFVYRQAKGTHILVLAVDAFVQGVEIGSGTSATLELGSGQASTAIIVYGDGPQDLGMRDLAMPDMTLPRGTDLATTPPDMAVTPKSPYTVAISNNTAEEGSPDPPVDLPPNTLVGDFLFATVYSYYQDTTITAPMGWTQYQTIPGSATDFRVSWFYRVADGTEPAELTFPRNPLRTVFIALTSYRGVVAGTPLDSGSGFAQIISGNPYTIPGITLANDHTLLVGTWISDAGPTPEWTAPPGMTARRSDTILVADEQFTDAGPTGDESATCSATLANGTAAMLIALRGE